MANTLNFGSGKWAAKEGSVLAYNNENNNFKPLPFTFTRASTATRVNESGLIESVASGVPRIDFLDNADGHLLLEPSRTNLITYSEAFDDAGWSKVGTASITPNTTISPDGSQNADTLSGATGTDRNTNVLLETISGLSTSTTYTLSLYVNKLLSTQATVYFRDSGTGAVLSETVSSGDGFQRVDITMTLGAATTAVNIYIGNTDSSIAIYGAQLEAGSYATSYIPTSGAAVTRAADASSQTPPSGVIGQSEGTLFVEVNYSNLSGTGMFLSIRPDSPNKVEVYRDGANVYGEIASTSTFSFFASKAVGTHKIAFAYKSGSSALYIDGSLVGQNTTSFSFTSSLALIAINARVNGTLNEAANYKQVLLYNTRLSNSELAALTSL